MKTAVLLTFLVLTFPQGEVKIDFLLNGQIHDVNKEIKLSEFQNSFIQLSLAEGSKLDPSKPLSGEIFIRSGDNATYMQQFENLEDKIYISDSIQVKTDYKIKPGDDLVIKINNVESEGDLVYSIFFTK